MPPINPATAFVAVALAALLALISAPAGAQTTHEVPIDWPLIPDQDGVTGPDFGPGEQFRLLFLRGTTDSNNASSGNITTYNNRAQATAAAGHSAIQALDTASLTSSFSPKFRALISTGAVDARDNTGTNLVTANHTDAPIYWLNGAQVADNYADLYDAADTGVPAAQRGWDSLEGRDENGDTFTSIAWTGSLEDGTGESGFQAGSGGTVRGGTLATLGSELHGDVFDRNFFASLYILSPLLTVETPPVLNADASLEYLRFDPSQGIAMQPAFSPDVYDYTASIANSARSLFMNPRVNDFRVGGATLDFTLTLPGEGPGFFETNGAQQGPFTLFLTSDSQPLPTSGIATYAIVVTAESGATQTYTINMHIRAPVQAAPTPQVLPSDWDLKPADVAVGQPFRLMFLNTGGVAGTRGDIGFYNGNSQNNKSGAGGGHLSIRGFAGEFRALISTAAVDARDNTATTGDGVPIYWLDGEKVADNYADFYDGSWDSRNPQNRNGIAVSVATTVLTGTNADGSGDLLFLPGGGGPYRIGLLNQGEGAEIRSATTNSTFNAQYALSPVLTVAAPGEAAIAAVLDGLSLSVGELSTPFAPATLVYNVEVPSDTATFTLTPSVSESRTNHQLIAISATHDGVDTLPAATLASGTVASIPLNVGVNTISVNVIAAGAPAQIYTLRVTRPSDDTTLSALEVVPPTGAPSVAVRVGQTAEYRAGVANDVSNITLRLTTTHPDATVTVNGIFPVPGLAPAVLPLKVGDNSIQFTVIAANGISLQTYTLTVNRRAPIPPPPTMQFLPFGSKLIPDGLQVGDVFRLMGVTNTAGNASSDDIAVYNTLTQTSVESHQRSFHPSDFHLFDFRTLISTPEIDMRDNTGTNRVTANHPDAPIYWVFGDKVADNYADFYDGNWDNHEPRYWQGNRAISPSGVNGSFAIWSGSNADGTGYVGEEAGSAQVRIGEHLLGKEIDSGDQFSRNSNSAAFHGISPVILVAPPTAFTLTTLEIGPASADNALIPAFDPTIFNYRVLVRQGTNITVRALDSTGFSTVTVNGVELPSNTGTSGTIDVPDSGETVIPVVLTAVNGATATYTLTATRQPSDAADLLGLTISEGTLTPAFNPASATNNYLSSVPNTVSSVIITPTIGRTNSNVSVSGTAASPAPPAGSFHRVVALGSNSFTLTVTSPNGSSTRTYTVVMHRRNPLQAPLARHVLRPDSFIVPAGLGVGDVFRLMFVGAREGRGIEAYSGNIDADYNVHARDEANNGATRIRPFADRFRAMVSSTGVDMRDNTATNRITANDPDAPIYWLAGGGGPKIADNYADLYDGIWNSVEYRDRNGDIQRTDVGIWTGSNQDGTGAIGHEVGTSAPVAGVAGTHDALQNRGFPYAAAGQLNFIYALSPLLVVGNADTLYSLNLTQADGTEVALSPAFSTAVTTYKAAVASTETSLTVTAEAAHDDGTAIVNISGNSGGGGGSGTTVQVSDGNNTITVTVSSLQSGTSSTYTVNLSRRTTPPPTPVTQSLPKNSPLVPSELNAGEQFRLMFLNISAVSGRQLDINHYNGTVQSTAAGGHTDIREFSNQFRALLSTFRLDARENTATTGAGDDISIYWLGGARVADDYADFYDGSWASRVPHDEDGNPLTTAERVMMTGSNADGSGDFGFEINRDPIRVGRLDQGAGAEIHAETRARNGFYPMYAMSPLINVVVADTALSSLAVHIDQGDTEEDLIIAPSFQPGITSYAASVSNDVTTLRFTPTVRQANATATLGSTLNNGMPMSNTLPIASGTDRIIPVGVGVNRFDIVVTSTLNSADTTTYTLTVTRLGEPPPVPDAMATLLAGSPLVPPEVPVGSQFRLLFVGDTATAQNADLGFYNNIVANNARNGVADIRPFAGQFRALASSVTLDARDNTGTRSGPGSGDVPIYWLGGDKVADTYADFYDNSWDSVAARDPSGNALDTTGLIIMTGSLENGIGQSTTRFGDCCNGNGNGIRVGRLDGSAGDEIDDGPIRNPGNTLFHLYGLSPAVTVMANGLQPPPPHPPVVAYPIPDQSTSVRAAFEYIFPANTFYYINNDVLTYSVTGLPGWLSFDSATRRFFGTPDTSAFNQSPLAITVTAADGDSTTADVSDTFTITVALGPPLAPANVRATAGNRSIVVTWDAVTDRGGYPGVRYAVALDGPGVTNSGGCRTVLTNCTLSGLTNGQPHFNIRVTAQTGPTSAVSDIRFTATTSLGPNYILVPTSGASIDQDAFITTWRTTVANETITIPTNGALTYAYTVNWGDGSTDAATYTGNATHEYATPGIKQVSITGTFPQIYFNGGGDRTKIQSVRRWGPQVWQSMVGSFAGCTNLIIEGNAGRPDLSEVTSMSAMFQGTTGFNTGFNSPIGHWDVSKVTDMSNMFQNSDKFNQDLSAWDVSSVTDFSRMFNQASAFNRPLGDWNVGAAIDPVDAIDMTAMFYNVTAFNQNLGAWDVGKVDKMAEMLNDVTLSTANYDALLNGWTEVTGGETALRQNVSFDAGKSRYCADTAREALRANGWTIMDGGRGLNCPLLPGAFVTTWAVTAGQTLTIPTNNAAGSYDYTVYWGDGAEDIDQTGDAAHLYTTAGNYEITITGDFPQLYINGGAAKSVIRRVQQWGDQKWRSMENSFAEVENFVIAPNAGKPDLSLGPSLHFMFRGASTSSPIGHWDVSMVTDMSQMFQNATRFNQDLSDWDVSSVTDFNRMFNGVDTFDQDLGDWDVSSAADLTAMFNGVTLSRENYDSLLAGWSKIDTLQSDLNFSAGNSQYCNQDAKNILTGEPNRWTITDGGADTGNCNLRFAAGVSIDDQTYTAAAAITLALPPAVGGAAPLTYRLAPLPPGLTLRLADANTRAGVAALLVGTPPAAMPATAVTYTATAADGITAALTFSITVDTALRLENSDGTEPPPNLTFTATQFEAVDYPLPGGTSSGTPFRYTLIGDFPAGLAFDLSTRALVGTPAEATPLTDLVYTVTDANHVSRVLTFSVAVAPELKIVAIPDQTYTRNQSVSLTLPVPTGGAAPLSYTLERRNGSPRLVSDLIFDPVEHTITGIPNAVFGGTDGASLRYIVKDANLASVQADFTLQVLTDLSFTTANLPDQNYLLGSTPPPLILPTATGGVAPLSYTLTSDSSMLPGLTFYPPVRALVGAPTAPTAAAGVTYTYTAQDANRATVALPLVLRATDLLLDGGIDDQLYMVGETVALTLPQAIDGTKPVVYALMRTDGGSPTLPLGLIFDPIARTISGTPAIPFGGAALRYTATDTSLTSVQADFTLRVFDALAFDATIANQTYTVNQPINLTLPAANGGSDGLSYSLTPIPDGLTFDATTRTLMGVLTMTTSTATALTYTATGSVVMPPSLSQIFTVAVVDYPVVVISDSIIAGTPAHRLTDTAGVGDSFTFTFTFSEPVSGFDRSFIRVNGGGSGIRQGDFDTVTAGRVYTLEVEYLGFDAVDSMIIVTVDAAAARSTATNRPTIETEATQAYDTRPVDPTIDTSIAGDNIVTPDERDAGVTVTGTTKAGSRVTLCVNAASSGDFTCPGGTSYPATVTGTDWSYTLSALDFDNDFDQGVDANTLTVFAVDNAGNIGFTSGVNLTVDTGLMLTITNDYDAEYLSVNIDFFTLTFTFSEVVAGFTEDDIQLTADTQNAIITRPDFPGSRFTEVTPGLVYSQQFTVKDPVYGNDGTLTITVPVNAAIGLQRGVGNMPTTATQKYDSVEPTGAVVRVSPVFIRGGSVAYSDVVFWNGEFTDAGGGDPDADEGITYSLENVLNTRNLTFPIPVYVEEYIKVDASGSVTFSKMPPDDNVNRRFGLYLVGTDKAGNTVRAIISLFIVNSAPTVDSVAAPDGFYSAGHLVPVTITLSEAVTVDTTGGLPRLALATGNSAGDGMADYTGGSGTNTLTFTYSVRASDDTLDLAYTGPDALTANGGSIESVRITSNFRVPLIQTLPAVGATDSLSDTSDVVLISTAPLSITGVSVDEGDAAIVTVTLNVDVPGGFSVDASTVEGTGAGAATAGEDYIAITSWLTFTGDPGETQTFTVAIINDAVPEDAETLTVSLANLLPPSASIDISVSATITILANNRSADVLELGTHTASGINLDLILPVTVGGVTYYHLDHNGSRSAEAGEPPGGDGVTHDDLNVLLNGGSPTAETQGPRTHDGRDDARSAIVGNYVLILPTREELQKLRADFSDVAPPGWVNDDDYWSASYQGAIGVVEYFLSPAFFEDELRAMSSDTALPTAFQVLPFVSPTPVFGETIEGQLYVYTVSQQVALTLPEASGGAAPLTYTLTRFDSTGLALPDGLIFNEDARPPTISGASTEGFATTGSAGLRYTATDANGAVASTDFRLRVNNFPTFDTSTILAPTAYIYTIDTAIDSLRLPPVTDNTGTGPLTYTLTPIPEGLIFDPSERTLTGTPSTGSRATDLTYTITDANAVAISLTFTVAVNASVLSIEDVVVNEGVGAAAVVVSLKYEVSGGFSVDVITEDGTARAGQDYTVGSSRTLVFNGGVNEMQTFTVTINDDAATENDETLTVSLDNLQQPQPTGGGVDISDGATIRILANDAPAASDSLDLGSAHGINLRLILPVTFDGKTYYHLDQNGNGDSGGDGVTHIALNNLLNDGSATEDTLPEGHDGRDDARSAIAGNYVVILPTLTELRALRNGQSPPGKPRPDWNSQYWTSTPGTAANTFVFYSLGSASNLDLARGFPGDTVFQVLPYVSPIPVFSETIANQIYPIGKMVALTLPDADTGRTTPLTYTLTPTASIPDGLTFNAADRTLTGTPDMATTVTLTYTATDRSDTPTSAALTFMVTVPPYPIVSIADVAVDEGDGAATVTVSVDVAVAGGFTVNASTTDDTATEVQDYTAVDNQMLTFDSTATEATFNVPIVNDAVVEGAETLMVSLLQVTGTTVTLPTAPATVTINDDDTAILTLTPATLTVTEGGIATFTVSVDAAVQGGFMVDASTDDDTATAPQDYTAVTSRRLTFTGEVGETQTFTVAITNDSATEGDETLTVSLDNLQPPLAGIVISAGATITIMANDASTEFLELGTHSGINLDLILPVTVGGVTYYHLDHNGNRSAETGTGGDGVTHDALNNLLNGGSPTSNTQSARTHDGRDDARSAIVGNYVLILPTREELQKLRADFSDVAPPGWVNDDDYWSASYQGAIGVVEYFLSPAFFEDELRAMSSDTALPTAFQVLPFVSATPVFRETIEGQLYVYTVSQQVALTLPEAFGGTAPLTYTLTRFGSTGPALPGGLTFNADPMERTISGASIEGFATTGSAGLRYTATDANGAVASTDFRLRVNNFPTFDTSTIPAPADDIYTRGTPITFLRLPPVTNNTGTGPLTVTLTPIPEGLTFDPSERTLAGTPSTGSLATDLTYTITDANAVAISLTFTVAVNASVLSIEDVVVNEGDGVAVVTVNSRYTVSGGFSVDVTTEDSTATAGLDYTAVNRRTLAFNGADDNEMQTFTVTINDDSATENDETLTVLLDNLLQPQPTGGGVDISDRATIRILANDAPSAGDVLDLGRHSDINLRLILPVTFDGKTYYHLDHNGNGDSGGDSVTHIALNNLLNDGSATEDTLPDGHDGRDDARSAIAENYVVILPTEEELRALNNGQSPPGKPLPAWNSQYWASTPGTAANFFVFYSFGGAAAIDLARGFPGDTVFQVLPYVSPIPVFSETIANQIYPIGKMVALTLPEAATGRTTPLTYTLTPTASIPNGLTFNAADRILTGTPDMATTVTLTYTATDSSDTPTSAALTFMVTVPPYPIVSIADVAVDEGDGAATVTVSVDVAVATGFTVNVSTTAVTATDVQDYTAVTNRMLAFDATATEVTFNVPITDDAVVEGAETLTVSLTDLVSTLPVTLPTAPATVTINDDDTASLTLTPATLTVTEGGIATFTVSVNAAVQGGFMVDASADNRTATAPQDYTAVTSQLTFTGTADETQTFTVAINDDSATEGAETLRVSLDNLQPPLDIDISASATITIMANDASTEFLELGTHSDINLDLIFPVTVGGVTYYYLDHNQNRSAEAGAHPGGDGVSHNALNNLLNVGNPTSNTQSARKHDGRDDARSAIVGNYVLILPTLEELLDLRDDFFSGAAPPSWVNGVYWSASPHGSSFLTLNFFDRELRTLGRSTALSTAFQVLPFVSATPVFRETITDQVYTVGRQVELTLPQAFGATAPLSYTLTPIPNGLTFNAADRTLMGSPMTGTTATLTYTATDSAATPTSTALTFMVTVSQNPIVSIADVVVDEGDGAATVTVSVDVAVATGFTVNASTTDGTATEGLDYTAVTNQMLTFDATATEVTFNVLIMDDAVVEVAETLTVSLTDLVSTLPVTLPTAPATVTINDDDTASLTLTPATLTVTEGGIATFTVSVNAAVQGGFMVDASTDNGTATAGQDYTAVTSRTLAFNGEAGEAQTFTVTINDDTATENDETLTVLLDNLQPSELTGVEISDGATIRILANDAPSTSDSLDLGSAHGINLNLILPVTFDGKTYYHLDHNGNGIADNNEDRVTHDALNLLLNGGSATEDTLPDGHDGRDDARSAIAENYVVILPTLTELMALRSSQSPPGPPTDWRGQYWASTPGTLADSFIYYGFSSGTALSIQIVPGATAFQVLPYVSPIPVFSETIANQIYPIGTMVALTLPEADTGRTTPLTYTLTPTASIPDGLTFNAADRVLTGTPDMATTVTLTYTATDSSDTPTSTALTFMVTVPPYPIVSIADVAVDEGDGAATVTVSVDVAVAGGFTVNASTTDGTATDVQDYTAVDNQMLTFDATATEATFNVPIVNDAVVEGAETLMVSLLQVTGTTVTLPTAPATVTINDDDTAILTLTPATLTVTEGGIATFTVSVDAAVQGGFMVDASTDDDTATAPQDYTAVTSRRLTFTGEVGETQTFTVAITNDSATEGAETLTVSLDNLQPPLAGIVISAGATITIMANDASTEFLELGTHSGINLDLILPVTVGGVTYYHLDHNGNRSAETGTGGDGVTHDALNNLLNGGSPTSNTQSARTHDGRDDARSAIVGNYVLILPTREELQKLRADFSDVAPPGWVNDDDYWSASYQGAIGVIEYFLSPAFFEDELRAMSSDTALPTAFQVLPFVSSTPVFRETITDQVYTAGQQVALTLPQAFGGTAPLSYTLTPIPNGLTFNAADRTLIGRSMTGTSATLTYTATDSAATPTSTALTFMVTVTTNPIVSIADVAVNEGDGAATVTVSVDTAVAGGFTVDASTANGTATTEGLDYTAVISQRLTFAGTATEATFSVPINDDAVAEDAETLTVSLATVAATTATVTLPADAATVTINDNDAAALTLTLASPTVTEGGTATFTVSVDKAVQGGFMVDVATEDGTAKAGEDYTAIISQTLTFAGIAGEARSSTVTITADEVPENTETLTVSLIRLQGTTATVGLPAAATVVTITDDDTLIVSTVTRLNEQIPSRVSQVTIAGTLAAVGRRVETIGEGTGGSPPPAVPAVQLGGQSSLHGLLSAHGQAVLGDQEYDGLLDGASFVLPLSAGEDGYDTANGGGGLSMWGNSEYSNLDSGGTIDGIDWGGDILSLRFGIDRPMDEDKLVGVALSWNRGSFDYENEANGMRGAYQYNTTNLNPYFGWALHEGMKVWGLAGYGQGEIRISEADTPGNLVDSATDHLSLAGGFKGTLLGFDAPMCYGSTTTLALKGDAALSRVAVDEYEVDGEDVAAQNVGSHRLRLLLEGKQRLDLCNGWVLTEILEVGVRYDGGDGISGSGIELGGGLNYSYPLLDLTFEGNVRTLVGNKYDEWGVDLSVRLLPPSGRGLFIGVRPAWGRPQSMADRLWNADVGELSGEDMVLQHSVDTEVGYGVSVSVMGASGVLTPFVGMTAEEGGSNRLRLGGRFSEGRGLSVSLEGEQDNTTDDASHTVLLRGEVTF